MSFEFTIRPATPTDVPVIFGLIVALADYEKLTHAVTGSAEALKEHLFGSQPYVEAILAEYEGQAVGFALFFHNYSTLLTKPGIYLEDLFVLPQFRRKGIGKAIFAYLAQLAIAHDCAFLEWSVLDWNEPAIAFYRRLGAAILENSRFCRITGNSLTQLADKPLPSIVRPALPVDLPILFSLIQAKAEFEQKPNCLTGNTEALKEHLFGSRRYAQATLVEQAEQVVGFAIFVHNYSTFLTKPGLYLDNWFILPEYQLQDMDRTLFTYLGQLALSCNCGRIEWLVDVLDTPALAEHLPSQFAFYETIGATVLPDWRFCRVMGESLTQLAAQTRPELINKSA